MSISQQICSVSTLLEKLQCGLAISSEKKNKIYENIIKQLSTQSPSTVCFTLIPEQVQGSYQITFTDPNNQEIINDFLEKLIDLEIDTFTFTIQSNGNIYYAEYFENSVFIFDCSDNPVGGLTEGECIDQDIYLFERNENLYYISLSLSTISEINDFPNIPSLIINNIRFNLVSQDEELLFQSCEEFSNENCSEINISLDTFEQCQGCINLSNNTVVINNSEVIETLNNLLQIFDSENVRMLVETITGDRYILNYNTSGSTIETCDGSQVPDTLQLLCSNTSNLFEREVDSENFIAHAALSFNVLQQISLDNNKVEFENIYGNSTVVNHENVISYRFCFDYPLLTQECQVVEVTVNNEDCVNIPEDTCVARISSPSRDAVILNRDVRNNINNFLQDSDFMYISLLNENDEQYILLYRLFNRIDSLENCNGLPIDGTYFKCGAPTQKYFDSSDTTTVIAINTSLLSSSSAEFLQVNEGVNISKYEIIRQVNSSIRYSLCSGDNPQNCTIFDDSSIITDCD